MEARSATIDRHGTTVVVQVQGALLLDAWPAVRAQVDPVVEEHPSLLVADLRGVNEIDSSGLAILLWMHRSQTVRGCRFVVVTDSPMLLRAFEVTRLDDVLDVRSEMPDLDG